MADLGTLLPLAFGLILLNGLSSTATFVGVGLLYALSGLYFRVATPVQPMKVISAYAIANAMSAQQISSAGLCMGLLLLLFGATGTMKGVRKLIPHSAVRGVQLVTGVLLAVQGIKFMLGQTRLQLLEGATEPFLSLDSIGPIPIGLALGVLAVIATLLLLHSSRAPASLVVVVGGVGVGLALGGWQHLDDLRLGLSLPQPLPYGPFSAPELGLALTALALPQIPMTIGNAVVAQADLAREYFGDEAARRCTPRAFTVSMGLANLLSGFFGGLPLCHGAGGLAAHYRFGARTAGSNLMIGGFFLAAGLLLGDTVLALFALLPLSILGALLCFAGAELCMMILDVKERDDLFVVITMLSVALVSNLAIGFAVGIAAAYLFRHTKMTV